MTLILLTSRKKEVNWSELGYIVSFLSLFVSSNLRELKCFCCSSFYIFGHGIYYNHFYDRTSLLQAPILVPSFAFNAYQGNVESALMKSVRVLAVMGAGVISFATVASADEAEHGTACPTYPWPHKGILDSYDHDHAS